MKNKVFRVARLEAWFGLGGPAVFVGTFETPFERFQNGK
jgi:hypothetical protein